MSTKIIGTFRIGEDIAVALVAAQGDPTTVTAATASMRRAVQGSASDLKFDPQATAIPMVVANRPASGDVPAGWNILLAAAQSQGLQPGLYAIDARLTVGSQIQITSRSAAILITEAAVS